jgi:hypothetical protein
MFIFVCDQAGQIGESGALEREGWGSDHKTHIVLAPMFKL